MTSAEVVIICPEKNSPVLRGLCGLPGDFAKFAGLDSAERKTPWGVCFFWGGAKRSFLGAPCVSLGMVHILKLSERFKTSTQGISSTKFE